MHNNQKRVQFHGHSNLALIHHDYRCGFLYSSFQKPHNHDIWEDEYSSPHTHTKAHPTKKEIH